MFTDTAPVFWLTLRQFFEGRSIRVIALLAFVPVLLGGIEIVASGSDADLRGFLGPIFNELSIPTLLPLIALILASTALGNEITDRTLPYLALKPWGRMRLVIEKLVATIATGTLIGIAFTFLAWIALAVAGSSADGELLAAMFLACVLAVAGYAAVFSLLSLLITRVLLAGLIYVLFWESLLARFIPGIRLLSVRHYAQSAYARVLDDPGVTISQQSALGTSIILLALLVLVCLLLSWIRIRSMDLD
jgi:ABC-2 type transport system permease protein